MKKLTREWVQKAEADYRTACRLSRGSDPVPDIVCFLFQQCSEKYLKALLQEIGLTIPRTHVLKNLLILLRPHHPSLASLQRGLVFLTRFAVDSRYPGFNAKKRHAVAARRWADRVRAATRAILKLSLHPPRRKK